MPKRVLFLVGPTGSGKSKLVLALARKLNGEIISCDSMHVYRGMDIGTDKPTQRERKSIPHHLLDLKSPRAECSVFEHRTLTLKAIDQILSKNRLPIVVGGSGFYFKVLLDGMPQQPGKQAKLREQLEALARKKGLPYLYARLKKMNQARAKAIHPNDKRRIIRALEVLESARHSKNKSEETAEGLNLRGIQPIAFGLLRDRAELYERIERRVDRMFDAGWLDEVKRLKRAGLSKTARAAIGYSEILDYLKGRRTLEEAKAEIKKRTRHLAKKQMTWFRKDPRISWIQITGNQFVLQACRTIVKAFPPPFRQTERRIRHSAGRIKVGGR